MEKVFQLLLCHLLGDYVLQNDFIAKAKGQDWWHLLVHGTLYIAPFYVAFGWNWQLAALWLCHVVIDAAKARYKKISYGTDQTLHILLLGLYWM